MSGKLRLRVQTPSRRSLSCSSASQVVDPPLPALHHLYGGERPEEPFYRRTLRFRMLTLFL